jgi:5-methylcytosine-specific restriction endonuclease McrA
MPRGVFIRTEEGKRHQSEALKGRIGGMTGKRHSPETKAKMRAVHLGKKITRGHHQSAEHKAKISASNTGRHWSAEQCARRRGENSHNWKGGVTAKNYGLRTAIERTHEFTQWHSTIFQRDKFTCQKCGDARGGNLRVHHIKTFRAILTEHKITALEQALCCGDLWALENGITLCEPCHIQIHKKSLL